MRLKTFQAKNMTDAMKQIRDTLGEDAIIVSSKEETGGWVRVTAAVEQANMPAEPDTPAPKKTKVITPDEDGFDDEEIISIITDTMLKHRVPAAVSDKVISAAMTIPATTPRETLAKALQKTFGFRDLYAKGRNKPVILVGPPGAGKTLMTAKLAARHVMEGAKPAVITTDIARAGGVEQLDAFLRILNLPLLQADDGKALRHALDQIGDDATHIIIDTGGLNPFDPQELKTLAKLIAVADMEAALVLQGGIDAEESAEMAMTFEILGITKLVPTRLDFARRLGGLLCAADRAALSFTIGSHTPQVADGIIQLTSQSMAELLMPYAPKPGQTKGRPE